MSATFPSHEQQYHDSNIETFTPKVELTIHVLRRKAEILCVRVVPAKAKTTVRLLVESLDVYELRALQQCRQ